MSGKPYSKISKREAGNDDARPISPPADSHSERIRVIMKTAPVEFLDNTSTGSCPSINLLTVAEAAEALTISVTSVRRLQQARQLPFFKVGGAVRFAKTDILSYLQSRRVEPVD
jgi:excisionase family DNA binding protein